MDDIQIRRDYKYDNNKYVGFNDLLLDLENMLSELINWKNEAEKEIEELKNSIDEKDDLINELNVEIEELQKINYNILKDKIS
jgi:chromosome segregation ATPase